MTTGGLTTSLEDLRRESPTLGSLGSFERKMLQTVHGLVSTIQAARESLGFRPPNDQDFELGRVHTDIPDMNCDEKLAMSLSAVDTATSLFQECSLASQFVIHELDCDDVKGNATKLAMS